MGYESLSDASAGDIEGVTAGVGLSGGGVSGAVTLNFGPAVRETISVLDGDTDLVPELQLLGEATAASSLLLATFSTTATDAAAPLVAFAKGGHGTIGSHTIVTDGEILGNITAFGDNGTDIESPAASIQFAIDGDPSVAGSDTTDMPGRIVFKTSLNGSDTLTERMRISNTGIVLFANGFAVGSDSEGDVLYSNGTNYIRLARGSDAEVLTLASGVPSWAAASSGPSQADQTAIEAETNQDTYVPPDMIKNSPGVAKAYCHITVSGGLGSGSYNVASITDSSTGRRVVVMTTSFADTNVVPIATPRQIVDDSDQTTPAPPAAGSCPVNHWRSASFFDVENSFVAFGDQ